METKAAPFEHVTLEQLEAAAAGLTGDILQRPPIYSALRKDGKRLYELARKGEIKPEEVEKRPVTVHRLAVSGLDAATGVFDLEVRCSGGTYVRTLIEDIGREVGSAAHMTALERTRHGPFCSEAEASLFNPSTGVPRRETLPSHYGRLLLLPDGRCRLRCVPGAAFALKILQLSLYWDGALRGPPCRRPCRRP